MADGFVVPTPSKHSDWERQRDLRTQTEEALKRAEESLRRLDQLILKQKAE